MQSQGNMSAANTGVKFAYKPVRRARVPLSCDPCRTRKLRCNRKQPCQNCITRVEENTCKYKGASNASPSQVQRSDPHTDAMQQRINNLENLIKSLMTQVQEMPHAQSNPATPPDNSVSNRKSTGGENCVTIDKEMSSTVLGNSGTTLLTGVHSIYKASNDWSNVLQEVKQLKEAFNQTRQTQHDPSDEDDDEDDVLQRTLVDGPLLLSGQVRQVEMPELLATLPPKTQVDKLVEDFFDSKHFALPTTHILHKPTFMREYEEHWRDPSQTDIMWLGLLFALLAICMLSYHLFGIEPPEFAGIAESRFQLYRLRTAQCLMKGDISKCLPYTIETLIHYATAEHFRKDNNARGQWMMAGVIVRAAINMGYHREPSRTSSISPLQADLRRRIWSCVTSIEHKSAFLVGFPSMMSAIESDILEPHNLHDWELSDDLKILPTSRSLDEFTPVTYIIAKARLFHSLGSITDFNNSLKPKPYDKVLEIDARLHQEFNKLPHHFRIYNERPANPQSKNAATSAIMQMEFLYHQGMCALHRKFLARGRVETQYSLSRNRCITSSLALLKHQRDLHKVGKLRVEITGILPYWFPARQNFLLAVMIICLDLEHRRRGKEAEWDVVRNEMHGWDVLFEAFEASCLIWKEVQDCSSEARRVYKVLARMLSSFEHSSSITSLQQFSLPQAEFETMALEQQLQVLGGDASFHGSFTNMPDDMDIDWATWDSFIEEANFEDAFQGGSFGDTELDTHRL